MRILQLTSHLEVGGITTHVVALSEALSRRGHEVVVASGGGTLTERLQHLGVAHWRVPLKTSAEFSPQVAWACWQLGRRRIAREPIELIHAHTRVAQVVAHWLWRRQGIPYVATWHGFYRRRLSRRWFPCTGLRTIAISEPVSRHLQDDFKLPSTRIRLIPHGVDAAHFASAPDATALADVRVRWGLQGCGPVIGIVGRLASGDVKGLDVVLGAAHHVQREVPKLQVLVVGDGPQRAFLEQEVRRLGMRERVHFVGTIDDVRLPLALMDVFVFSSRKQEGFGLSLLEAMAAGRPIVAARNGAVPHIIEHGRDGWLVTPDDAHALAQGIVRLLKDPAAASQLARQAQERVREAFRLDHMVSKVEAVYREVKFTPRVGF